MNRYTKADLLAGFDGFLIGDSTYTGYYTVSDIAKAVQARVREFCANTAFPLKRIGKWQVATEEGSCPCLHVYVWLLGTDGRCARIELYLYPRKEAP